MTGPAIDHARGCPQDRPLLQRLAWDGTPELWCPGCGRTTPVDPPAKVPR